MYCQKSDDEFGCKWDGLAVARSVSKPVDIVVSSSEVISSPSLSWIWSLEFCSMSDQRSGSLCCSIVQLGLVGSSDKEKQMSIINRTDIWFWFYCVPLISSTGKPTRDGCLWVSEDDVGGDDVDPLVGWLSEYKVQFGVCWLEKFISGRNSLGFLCDNE